MVQIKKTKINTNKKNRKETGRNMSKQRGGVKTPHVKTPHVKTPHVNTPRVKTSPSKSQSNFFQRNPQVAPLVRPSQQRFTEDPLQRIGHFKMPKKVIEAPPAPTSRRLFTIPKKPIVKKNKPGPVTERASKTGIANIVSTLQEPQNNINKYETTDPILNKLSTRIFKTDFGTHPSITRFYSDEKQLTDADDYPISDVFRLEEFTN